MSLNVTDIPSADSERLARFRSRLRGAASSVEPMFFSKVASTNLIAKSAANEIGSSAAAVFIADEQSNGRGRETRRFYSPADSGIYMSLLFAPKLDITDSTLLTPTAAVAAALAIERVCGKHADVKWVNDLFIDRRKVCGILAELVLDYNADGALEYRAVVGVGINVSTPRNGFASEIKDIAGAVSDGGDRELRDRLAAEVTNVFFELAEELPDTERILREYRSRLFFLGDRVTVLRGEGSYSARAVDVDERFRLIVERDGGRREALSDGEIRIKL